MESGLKQSLITRGSEIPAPPAARDGGYFLRTSSSGVFHAPMGCGVPTAGPHCVGVLTGGEFWSRP